MKLRKLLLAVACLLAGIGADTALADAGDDMAATSRDRLVGKFIQPLTVQTIDGRSVRLATAEARRPVYLKFWATWCVPCRKQMPHLQHVYDRHGKDLDVVAVNLGLDDTLQSVREFRDSTHLTVPTVIDASGALQKTFGVVVTPLHVLIGRDGRVAYIGHSADEKVDAAIEQVMRTETAAKPGIHEPESALLPLFAAGDIPGAGKRAPAFKLVSAESQPLSLSDGKQDKPTVLVFTTTWCESYLLQSRPTTSAACTNVREIASRVYEQSGDRARWLGVAGRIWNTPGDVQEYRKAHQIPFSMGLDAEGEAFGSYRIRELPTVIVIDTDGVIRERLEGAAPGLEAALRRWTAAR